MKNIYLLLFLWSGANLLPAQTIHLVLMGNTKSTVAEFGTICSKDIAQMQERFVAIEKATDYQVNTHLLIDDQFRPKALADTLAVLSVAPKDVVFFYYTGGAFCEAENPLMDQRRGLRLGKDGTTDLLSTAFFPLIEGLGARLTVFFIDACALVRSVEPFQTKRAGSENSVYESLFSACGTLSIFSSQCKEYSYGDAEGSLLTNAFLATLDHYIDTGSENLSWQNLLEDTQQSAQQKAADIFRLQHPTFFFSPDFTDQCQE